MKKVFIGIPATDQIKLSYKEFQEKYPNLPVKWNNPENLHLTLLPPVEIEDVELPRIIETFSNSPVCKPFEISFSFVECGPTPKHPRLIWAKGEPTPEIIQAKEAVEKLVNYRPDREFSMHFTLARFNTDDISETPLHGLHLKIHWHMPVTEFALFESTRDGDDFNYPIIETFPLYE